jgi:hypothetical protein
MSKNIYPVQKGRTIDIWHVDAGGSHQYLASWTSALDITSVVPAGTGQLVAVDVQGNRYRLNEAGYIGY